MKVKKILCAFALLLPFGWCLGAEVAMTNRDMVAATASMCATAVRESSVEALREDMLAGVGQDTSVAKELAAKIETMPGWQNYLNETSRTTCACAMKQYLPRLLRARSAREFMRIGDVMIASWEKKPEQMEKCGADAAAQWEHLLPKQDAQSVIVEFVAGCSKAIIDQSVVQFAQRAMAEGRAGYSTVTDARKTLSVSPVWGEYIVPMAEDACRCVAEPHRKRMEQMASFVELGRQFAELQSSIGQGEGARCMEAAMSKHEAGRKKW
jgi:hypothetical protein